MRLRWFGYFAAFGGPMRSSVPSTTIYVSEVIRYAEVVTRPWWASVVPTPPEAVHEHDASPNGLLDPYEANAEEQVDAGSRARAVSTQVVVGSRSPGPSEMTLFSASSVPGDDVYLSPCLK